MAEVRGEEDGEQGSEDTESLAASDSLAPAVLDLQTLLHHTGAIPGKIRFSWGLLFPTKNGSRMSDHQLEVLFNLMYCVHYFGLLCWDPVNLLHATFGAQPLSLTTGAPLLKLALARLCDDEKKRQPAHPDLPTVLDAEADHPVHRFQECSPGDIGLQHVLAFRKKGPGDIVNELFKEAKEHGAVPLDEATDDCSKTKSFSGGGYKLGHSDQARSEYIFGEYEHEFADGAQVLLKLWKNGFSLDDGDLRSYTDPTNAEFLESIKRGEIPPELRRMVHGGLVHLDMEDHQDQEYVRPRLRFKAFSGEGQKLGSLTPEIVSTPSSPEEERKIFFNTGVVVDDLEPTTKIQIRLADGSRLIRRFNLTHRIMDLRHFITQSRPEFSTVEFVLVTTFPNKELIDENVTLQEADILNTVILQRLK
ncbi:UBX domain-containing protein 2B isoform X2 [Ambystoma mexicanum]|uniref:UBX domain-containing protein 2B isoform X2 n=1 Tax=Ambystoma mexicanum TaxID=8296 RepID=UPI0037E74C90